MSKHPPTEQRPAVDPHGPVSGAAPNAQPVSVRAGRWILATAFAVAAGLLVSGAWWWAAQDPQEGRGRDAAAPASAQGDYVANTLCLGCHQDEGQKWQLSHHAGAMTVASASTVSGDFDNTEFSHGGLTSRFFMDNGRYFVRTDGPDGKLSDFEISYTFGVAPLQQYLIAMPGGRLQPLQIAWDTERRQWFHLLPEEVAPPGDVLHWTGRYQTANTMCISCHTTGFEKRYDAATDTFASRWEEPNVSCQACHGPGDRHVQWAQQSRTAQSVPSVDETYGLLVNLKAASARQQGEVCAACHSRRSELAASPMPGGVHLDSYLPALLTEGLYHPDGQQQGEVFADGSFRQSRMHAMGVGCGDCHDPHSGKLQATGNGLCLQCHAEQPNPAFASAAGVYDAPSHHFHESGSAGAQCVACHMPSTTYMQVQPRPDHSLRIPRPDLSVKLGTPNACSSCHADRTAHWAADNVEKWYGAGQAKEPHFGEAFAAARAGQPFASAAVVRVVNEPGVPPIVRSTALSLLRADPDAGVTERMQATRDADPEVRAAAADSLQSVPAGPRVYALAPLLTDPVRAVRIAAAWSLSSVPRDQMASAALPAFDAALAEFIAVQELSLDMPGAQLNLAAVYQNTGEFELAEQHALAALRIDPDFTAARSHLAKLYNSTARNAEAEQVLSAGIARTPADGELQFSLGLLLAEENRLPEAVAPLQRAAALMPLNARASYNLGLALQQLGRRAEAEAALLKAEAVDPRDTAVLYALAVLHAQLGNREQALEWAGKVLAINPGDAAARQLIGNLRALNQGP